MCAEHVGRKLHRIRESSILDFLSDTDLSIPFVFKTRVKSQPSKIDLIVGKTFESISISNDFAPSRKTERQMDA